MLSRESLSLVSELEFDFDKFRGVPSTSASADIPIVVVGLKSNKSTCDGMLGVMEPDEY